MSIKAIPPFTGSQNNHHAKEALSAANSLASHKVSTLPTPPQPSSHATSARRCFQFLPSQELKYCVATHPIFNNPTDRAAGVTRTVAELAGERLSGNRATELGKSIAAMQIVEDVVKGKDGYSGRSLNTNFPSCRAGRLETKVERVLADCSTEISCE